MWVRCTAIGPRFGCWKVARCRFARTKDNDRRAWESMIETQVLHADAETSSEGELNGSLQRRIQELGPWFHNLRLRGIETAPEHFLGNYPEVKFESFRAALPADMNGKSVLDIGCNAGFYSFEMKRRGAARVLGLDTDPGYLRQARFAAEVNGLDVEFRQLAVWQIAELGEKFDL